MKKSKFVVAARPTLEILERSERNLKEVLERSQRDLREMLDRFQRDLREILIAEKIFLRRNLQHIAQKLKKKSHASHVSDAYFVRIRAGS